jgi:O-antigen/teichoic acid export membrane protein
MSSLRKGILVYTASNLISTGIPFLILPLLTAYLSKEDYGVLSNFTGLINLLSPIIAFSFVSAFTRVYYKDDVHQEHYTQTGINFQLMLTAGLSILLFLFENYIQELTGIAPVYIRVLALYCFIFSLSELLFTLWRIENKVWTFFFFRMARTFVELGLTLVLITQYGFDYQGRIIAILGSGALLMVVFIPFLLKRRYVGKGMKKEHLNHALRFGIPLIPHF